MTLDETRKLWAAGGVENGGVHMSDTEVLELVLKRSAQLRRVIRRRDLRETIAAGVGLLLLTPVLVLGPWLARAGVLLIAAGCALIVVRLGRARRLPAPRPEWPLAEALGAERTRIAAQIRLLETVLWWYIAPLAVGPVLIAFGLSGPSRFTLGYALFTAAVAAGIYGLNRWAIAKDLGPRQAELDDLLARLENG